MIIQTNWYAGDMQSEREGNIMITSISFYLGNHRRVFVNSCYKIQGRQTENQGGQTKKSFRHFTSNFLQNVCQPCLETVPAPMGVDHGGTGDRSLTEFGVGGANANCPLRFCHRYKKERPICGLQNTPNPFQTGALFDDAPPDPYSAAEGTPLLILHSTRHQPTFGARHASPKNSSQIYAYAGAPAYAKMLTMVILITKKS